VPPTATPPAETTPDAGHGRGLDGGRDSAGGERTDGTLHRRKQTPSDRARRCNREHRPQNRWSCQHSADTHGRARGHTNGLFNARFLFARHSKSRHAQKER